MSTKPVSILATEPVALAGAVQAFLQALLVTLAAFDVGHLTGLRQAAIQGLLTAGWALVGAAYARSRSISKATLEQLAKG